MKKKERVRVSNERKINQPNSKKFLYTCTYQSGKNILTKNECNDNLLRSINFMSYENVTIYVGNETSHGWNPSYL